MRRSPISRAFALPLAALLALAALPFETAPAEAGRIKFRFYRSPVTTKSADTSSSASTSRPVWLSTGSSSSSLDEKGKPKPVGAAARAAARAQAALEAEKGQVRGKPAATYEPVPMGPTTDYGDGVSCIAGC